MTAPRTRQLDGGACGLDQLPTRASSSSGQWPQLDLGRLPAPSIGKRWQAAQSRRTASQRRGLDLGQQQYKRVKTSHSHRPASGLNSPGPDSVKPLTAARAANCPLAPATMSGRPRQQRGLDSGKPRHGLVSVEPQCSQPGPSQCPRPHLSEERVKKQAATAHAAQSHNHHAAATAICPASCGKKPCWLVV